MTKKDLKDGMFTVYRGINGTSLEMSLENFKKHPEFMYANRRRVAENATRLVIPETNNLGYLLKYMEEDLTTKGDRSLDIIYVYDKDMNLLWDRNNKEVSLYD